MAQETPLSPAGIEKLRAEAEARMVHSPRDAWSLACVAHSAARRWPDDLLEATCALTLGIALNAMGRFHEALERLAGLTERFLAHGRPVHAARCHSEITLTCAYLGQFEEAAKALARARDILADLDDPVAPAYCDRAAGLLHQEQNEYAEAVALLQQAGEVFATAGYDEAALTWCDLAYSQRYLDPDKATFWIDKARQVSSLNDSQIHRARCDHIQALISYELNRYAESLSLWRQARTVFTAEDMIFRAAFCDMCQGIAHYHMNQYDDALQAFVRAHTSYADQALSSYVAMCDLNIAVVLYATNRYSEALELYERVAEEALAKGRTLRAARCYTNMGLCYDRLGRYDRALVLHDRAHRAFLESGDSVYAALCQENLAGTYCRLGRRGKALEHYTAARHVFAEQEMHIYGAYCDIQIADLYLALDQLEEAVACLERARATCQQAGMDVYVAACDREMAHVRVQMGQEGNILPRLREAKTIFTDKGLLVDAALCDVAAGEVYLEQQEAAMAQHFFTQGLNILEPSLPDEAWRAHYGLGRCALARDDRAGALSEWLAAVALANKTRAALPTERLSGDFFATRRRLYEETLGLALGLDDIESALTVVETGKAQTFSAFRWTNRPRWSDAVQGDPYWASLLDKEERLRREMESLRGQMRVIQPDDAGPALRSEDDVRRNQPEMLARLTELADTYEAVVERLRLVAPQRVEALSPAPFSVRTLRQAAGGHLPSRWACLSYHVSDDALLTFFLDSEQLQVHHRPLSAYDRLALRQCTEPAREFRELIYRGTIRGRQAPGALGQTFRRHLYQLLIPPEVADLSAEDVLIVAPHGQLHGLAFQALLDADGRPLVKQVPLAYVPSLDVFQMLLRQPSTPVALNRVLACGLSDFDSRASDLPHVADEIAALSDVLGDRLDVLWNAEATREAVLHLDGSGELARYDAIHFATHAVLDHLSPSQSRVMLADDDLTLVDILNLKLRAWLVVLSACEGALGQQYPGDEMMGLARAFFLAGAKTVLASLWLVEDEVAGEFMGYFYQLVEAGESVAQALRTTQIAMADEGYEPYRWAPFIPIGLP